MKNRHIIIALVVFLLCSCGRKSPQIEVVNDGDNATVTVTGDCAYLMLPVQESSWEVRVRPEDAPDWLPEMEVRLAADSIDYYLPYRLPKGRGKKVLKFSGLWEGAVAWKNLRPADSLELRGDLYRPAYHHSPLYGWMNDPNGMFFKDGEYHLFYQHNPYGSTWGNMHWGHAVSRDLVHWTARPVALQRDTLGHIYSGCAIIDRENASGFGKDAVVLFYTSHLGERECQCIAYSTDNGRTFTKYEANPVLEAADGNKDFRDPKVFRYEDKWVMVVACHYEFRFFSSTNLKDWEYTGSFGEGYGARPSMFECPDLIELPVDGGKSGHKWLLIANVNPGFPYGGSGTEYFTGEFDGKTFVCDSPRNMAKWLDYGKDHYAAVTFSGVEGRAVAMAWMSNWQYADKVPSVPFRSANSLPRELSLFSCGDEIYAASYPVPETAALVKETVEAGSFTLKHGCSNSLNLPKDGPCSLSFNLRIQSASACEIIFSNSSDERLRILFDETKLSIDRSESGLMTDNADFSVVASAPMSLCSACDGYDVDIFIDHASVEIFVDGGRVAMTELVFPTEPYGKVSFLVPEGTAAVSDLCINELGVSDTNSERI